MKKTSTKQYAAALYEVTKDIKKDKDLEKILQNFLTLLVKNHQLNKADIILSEFERYAKRVSGIATLSVTSARPLSREMIKKVRAVFGEKAEITELVEPEILGGIKIRTEDRILDGSIRTQINRLKQSLL